MIRIMTAEETACTTITVDGKLAGDDVETVAACCTDALSRAKPVCLHLRDVIAIDERGRSMLQHLASKGVTLTAKGIYSSYIVDQSQMAGLEKRRVAP